MVKQYQITAPYGTQVLQVKYIARKRVRKLPISVNHASIVAHYLRHGATQVCIRTYNIVNNMDKSAQRASMLRTAVVTYAGGQSWKP